MDDAASGVTSAIEPLVVGSLLTALQESGWKLSVDQHLRARHLMVLVGDARPLTFDLVRDSIAPIVCCTADEQRTFDSIFASWARAQEAEKEVAIPIVQLPARPPTVDALPRRFRIIPWIVFAAVALLLAFFFRPSEGDLSGQWVSPRGLLDDVIRLASVAATVLLLVAGILALVRRNRVLALRRDAAASGDLEERLLRVGTRRASAADLRMLSRRLQVRKPSETEEIDVRSTIQASARAGGWLMLVRRPLRFTPDYLVLIDRSSMRDHLASYYESIVDALLDADVPIAVYEFHRDPRLVWKRLGPRRPVSLADLQRKQHNARLLLFSDAGGLIDPYSGRSYDWTQMFAVWRERYILPPPGVAAQERRVRALHERGFEIVAADSAGLATLGEIFASDPGRAPGRRNRQFPSILEGERARWLDRRDPPEDLKAQLIAQLREYLGPAGFDWLCASAVYPSLEWRLTTYLGSELGLIDDSRSTVAALAHLPWFRQGGMPDWLRIELLRHLSPDRDAQVRAALDALFNGAFEGMRGGFVLPLSRRGGWLSRLRRLALLRDLRASQPAGGRLSDRVLLEFMSGPKLESLTVRIPRAILQLFEHVPPTQVPRIAEAEEEPAPRLGSAAHVLAMILIYATLPLSLVIRIFRHRNRELRWHSSNGLAFLLLWLVDWFLTLLLSAAPLIGCFATLLLFIPNAYLGGALIASFIDAIHGRRMRIWGLSRITDELDALGTGGSAKHPARKQLPRSRALHLLVSYWLLFSVLYRFAKKDTEIRWHSAQGIALSLTAATSGLALLLLSVATSGGLQESVLMTWFIPLSWYVLSTCTATMFALQGRRLRVWPLGRMIDWIAGESNTASSAESIPNYLVQSIVVTLCCCLPLGFVAIVFAAQVNSKRAAGDIAGAHRASEKAKMFCWIAFGVGLAISLFWMVINGWSTVQGLREGMARD